MNLVAAASAARAQCGALLRLALRGGRRTGGLPWRGSVLWVLTLMRLCPRRYRSTAGVLRYVSAYARDGTARTLMCRSEGVGPVRATCATRWSARSACTCPTMALARRGSRCACGCGAHAVAARVRLRRALTRVRHGCAIPSGSGAVRCEGLGVRRLPRRDWVDGCAEGSSGHYEPQAVSEPQRKGPCA
jgi:hypothetical protein